MERIQPSLKTSTLQEWASFLNVLNSAKNTSDPLLKKAESADRMVMHLEKQFSNTPQQAIFRRLGRHTQLVLRFS
jgi:hypothetical protein